ncbi:MAG: glycosyltransferase family 4 protein [Alphaproteobacteria bacterium]
MKILQVMAGDSVGGAETFFVDAVKALHETEHQQYVITRNNNAHKIKQIKQRDIPLKTSSFHNLWRFPTAHTIRSAIKEFNPDIVHHYMGRAGSYSQPGNHVNIGWYGGYYKPWRFKHCQHHVAVTQDIVRHIIANGVPKENAHLLHIYAEFDKGTPIDRAQFNTPEDAPLLLSLSRLHVKKGLDGLLDAMVKVPDAYLWIAGSGPAELELKLQMRQLKLENRVRFLGWRNDQADLLATADICAFPSRYEPFGAVVIEAWACKRPLITAKAAGPKAYVKNEENGLIVNIDDAGALANAINRVIKDKELCNHIVENGYKAYQQSFTRDVFKKNVTALYEKILETR